jgi:hypothetical protein
VAAVVTQAVSVQVLAAVVALAVSELQQVLRLLLEFQQQ